MKTTHKIIKYLAIALAVAIIAGIFATLMSLANGLSGIKFTFGGSKTEAEKIFADDEESVLYIEIGASKVNIHEGDILSGVTDNEYIDIETRGNKLVAIEQEHSSIKNDETYLDITIPEGFEFEKIVIFTGAGTVEAQALRAEKLELTLGAGEVTVDYLSISKKADVEGGAGKLNVKDGVINNLDASMGVGKASICAKLIGENDLETGVGDLDLILLGGRDSYKINASTGIGDFKIDGDSILGDKTVGSGNNEIDIDCGIGSVTVTFE